MPRRLSFPSAVRAACGSLALALAAPGHASDPAPGASGDALARDLFSVLALRGKPCGRVVEATRQGEQDYLVRCESGNRYRIRIEGDRVVIEDR